MAPFAPKSVARYAHLFAGFSGTPSGPGPHTPMAMDYIRIRGARTHNLKNIDLELPRDKLIVITGLSGSGKSSLAFDTLYAEGQRRYVESLSAYARQFLSMMEKPDVDHIEGLSPAISIEQKSTSHNPRSTVGTITEIYDYLRLLFARAGEPRCPDHDLPLAAQTVSQMVDQVLALPEGSKLMLLAPVMRERKGEHLALLDELRAQGFVRARIDGRIHGVAKEQQARQGGGVRPLPGPGVPAAAPGRVLRDRPAPGRWHRHHRSHGRRGTGGNHLPLPLCLPPMRPLDQRAGAAAVLLQQPGRRLQRLRWSGRQAVLRCPPPGQW